jgi:ribosomal protein S18 acetylase RimI-like enzyme
LQHHNIVILIVGIELSYQGLNAAEVKIIDLYFILQKHARRISKYYKEKGLWRTLLHSLVRVSYQRDEFLFFEIDLVKYSPRKDITESGDFAVATAADIERIPNYFDGWFSKRQALSRLEQGHKLFLVRRQQEAVSFRWVEFGRVTIPALGLLFTVPDTTAYLAYSYTLPDHRKAGVASWSQHCTLEYLRRHGYRTAFLITSPITDIPIRLVKKSGFRLFLVVFYQRFFLFLKQYHVKDPDTGREKVFRHIWKSDHEIWKTFSKY